MNRLWKPAGIGFVIPMAMAALVIFGSASFLDQGSLTQQAVNGATPETIEQLLGDARADIAKALLMMFGAASFFSAGWLAWGVLSAPANHVAQRGLRGPWIGGLVLVLIICAAVWVLRLNDIQQPNLQAEKLMYFGVAGTALACLAYWLATLMAAPRTISPAVPLAR